jgi:hypothetical protein
MLGNLAVTPSMLVGYRDESGKKDAIHKVFTDAYKSPLSILIVSYLVLEDWLQGLETPVKGSTH